MFNFPILETQGISLEECWLLIPGKVHLWLLDKLEMMLFIVQYHLIGRDTSFGITCTYFKEYLVDLIGKPGYLFVLEHV
jgi:hypothetical protein